MAFTASERQKIEADLNSRCVGDRDWQNLAAAQADMRVAAGRTRPSEGLIGCTPQLALLESQIFENVECISTIRSRVSAIADKLVGSRPENTAATGPGYGGNGVLDSLRSVAVVQRDALERIMEDLARMEADLGL